MRFASQSMKRRDLRGRLSCRLWARLFIFAIPMVLLLPTPARADTTINMKIDLLQHYRSHSGVLVRLAGTMPDPDGCGRTDWYILPDNITRAAFIQSMLLTARSTGTPVWMTIGGCLEGLPRILDITM